MTIDIRKKEITEKKQKETRYENKFENKPEEKPVEQQTTSTTQPTKEVRNIDYLSLIVNLLNIVKDFITSKIKQKISKKEFFVAKEVIYQMIIIIDKAENIKDIAELKSVCHFGFPIEECKDLKSAIQDGYIEKDIVFDVLSNVELKKILILYKYLDVSNKKFHGHFYKLDIEQIDENLFGEFAHEEKNSKKVHLKFDNESQQPQSSFPIKKNKNIFSEENFPDLLREDNLKVKNISKFEDEEKKLDDKKGANPLTGILTKGGKEKENKQQPQEVKKKESPNAHLNEFSNPQPNKLKEIFQPNPAKKFAQMPQKKSGKGGMSIKNKDKYDDMFPEL